jgi:hypothetical protein
MQLEDLQELARQNSDEIEQLQPAFRTLIQHFLEISKSATNPATMRLYSSRPSTPQDHRHLGTLWATASILRGSRETRVSV